MPDMNAWIVSEPGHADRHFRMRVREAGTRTLGAEEWEHDTAPQNGSWWPEWIAWLDRLSSARIAPPMMGANRRVLGDAPGSYVLER